MFVETIVLPRSEWERGQERLRYTTDPPETLVVSIAWDSGDGQVTGINVWETAGAIADFYMERVRPFVEAEGEPTNKPQRHGEPLAFICGDRSSVPECGKGFDQASRHAAGRTMRRGVSLRP